MARPACAAPAAVSLGNTGCVCTLAYGSIDTAGVVGRPAERYPGSTTNIDGWRGCRLLPGSAAYLVDASVNDSNQSPASGGRPRGQSIRDGVLRCRQRASIFPHASSSARASPGFRSGDRARLGGQRHSNHPQEPPTTDQTRRICRFRRPTASSQRGRPLFSSGRPGSAFFAAARV